MKLLLSISVCFLYILALQTFAQAELTIKMTPTITVTLTGPSGEYQIRRAQVLGNAANWVTLTNVTMSGSPFIFCDLAAGGSQQFYQAVQQTTSDNPNPQLLVWIPPGTFMMGSPSTEQTRFYYENPQTQVTISQGFWMSKYEVTQGEYQVVMGRNPGFFTGDLSMPVEGMSWLDATNYCWKLTQQENVARRLPVGYVYRLPTEAEWEYCCRAGTTTRFSYGDDLNYTNLMNYAWCYDNSSFTTHPVGTKLPNPWGLYDMYGNVWEWCSDWFGNYPGGIVTDPMGASLGTYRVQRGGSWDYDGRGCGSATRGFGTPSNRSFVLGFRVVLARGK